MRAFEISTTTRSQSRASQRMICPSRTRGANRPGAVVISVAEFGIYLSGVPAQRTVLSIRPSYSTGRAAARSFGTKPRPGGAPGSPGGGAGFRDPAGQVTVTVSVWLAVAFVPSWSWAVTVTVVTTVPGPSTGLVGEKVKRCPGVSTTSAPPLDATAAAVRSPS